MKGKILIADDVPENIQVLGKILSSRGYDLAVAENGQSAVEMVDKVQPDVVLMDVMMPVMDGITACKQIKAQPAHGDLPILFISAKTSTEDKIRGFEAGASDYINKPFDSSEVLARVETHIRLKKASDAIKEYNINLEKLLEERTRELIVTERNAAFSLFSQGIIHNLKNPMSIISGGVQYLQYNYNKIKETRTPEEIQAFLEKVVKYIDRFETANNQLLEMVNSLMAKVRTDSEADVVTVNLNDILQKELRFYEADMQFKHRTDKHITLTEKELYVRIVPGEFNQIVQNLIRNALDAMYQQNDAALTIRTFEREGHACCSIEDNGPGIPEEAREKIFDPFYTTKPKASEKSDAPKGTGLGLYMVKTMLEKYNGHLELESQPGKGTCFTICLPQARP